MVNFMNFVPGMGSPASSGASAGYLLPDIVDAGRILLGEKSNSFSGYDSMLGSSMIYSPSMTSYLGAVPKFGAAGLFGSFPTFGPTSGNLFGTKLQEPPFLKLSSFSSKQYFAPIDMNNLPTIELNNSASSSGGGGSSAASGVKKSSPTGSAAPAGGSSAPTGSAPAGQATTASARSLPSEVKSFVEKFNGDGSVANRPKITTRFVKDDVSGKERVELQLKLNENVAFENEQGNELILAIKELAAKYDDFSVRLGDDCLFDKSIILGEDFKASLLKLALPNTFANSDLPDSIKDKYEKSDRFYVNKRADKHYYVDADRSSGEESLRLFTSSGSSEEGWLYIEHAANSGSEKVRRWYEMGTSENGGEVMLTDEPLKAAPTEYGAIDATFYHQHPKKFDDRYEPPSFADLDSYLKFVEANPDAYCNMRVVTSRGIYVIMLQAVDGKSLKDIIKDVRDKIGDGKAFDAETVKQRDEKLLNDPLCKRYEDLGLYCRFEEFAEDVPENATPQVASEPPAQTKQAEAKPAIKAEPKVESKPQPEAKPAETNSGVSFDAVTIPVEEPAKEPAVETPAIPASKPEAEAKLANKISVPILDKMVKEPKTEGETFDLAAPDFSDSVEAEPKPAAAERPAAPDKTSEPLRKPDLDLGL